jgi:MATE family multidrug resistance protein
MDAIHESPAPDTFVPAKTLAEEVRSLLKLAGPIALAQAGMSMMGLVDTAVVGRVGADSLAAAGLGNGIFFGVAIVGLGWMMGFEPLVAQAIGAGRREHARVLLIQSAWMALFATLVLCVPIALSGFCLEPLGIEPGVAHEARSFILCRLPGVFPMLLFSGARAYLQGLGYTRAMVVSMVLANLANFGLDVVLVFGAGPIPPLHAAGAGLATSVCSAVQCVVLLWFARPQSVNYDGPSVSLRPDKKELRAALRVGFPVGLQLGAEIGVFSIAGFLAGKLGAIPLAAHQVALALASFTFCFALGVGGAGAVRVGWAVGARAPLAMRRSGFVALATGASVMSISAVVFYFFPYQVARIISDSPEVLATAAPLLAVAALFQIADGLQAVGAGVLRGLGDTRFAFIANACCHYLIGLPIALICGLVLHRGVIGIWWGLSSGLFCVAAALVTRFVLISRKAQAPLEDALADAA